MVILMSDYSFATDVLTSRTFFPMTNVIQPYSWGSRHSLKALFNISNPECAPQAELWMGTHPNGGSTISLCGQSTLLYDVISQDPELFLNPTIAQKFGELPFLFKVLAAEKALSIQVHPNKAQAEKGFLEEEKLAIPIDDKKRNYKDANHKPELIYALTDYQAMNGFRPIEEILHFFTLLDIPELRHLVNGLVTEPNKDGLKQFFSSLLSLRGEQKEMSLVMLMVYASLSEDPTFKLIEELEKEYPNDLGLFAPLMLNVVTLSPGQAMYLDAQTPHAYIRGTGLEIMANSDNVLRAGLTSKHIDVDELVSCTRFDEFPADKLIIEPSEENGALHFPIPVSDFKFSILLSSHMREVVSAGAEILLPLDNHLVLMHENGETCSVAKGQSVFIPAFAKRYVLISSGRVARAYC